LSEHIVNDIEGGLFPVSATGQRGRRGREPGARDTQHLPLLAVDWVTEGELQRVLMAEAAVGLRV
jgi:hypothetical protein